MKTCIAGTTLGLVLICTLITSAFAECGVGQKIWAGNDSTSARVMAFTTDVFTWKGISTTFEIFGCGPEDNIFRKADSGKIRHYASNNFDRLAEDMARGDGEHLAAFASLLGLADSDYDEFAAFSQENFERLFPHDDVTVGEFLAALGHEMAQHETLSRYVEA